MRSTGRQGGHQRLRVFITGVLAALAMVAAMLARRSWSATPSLVELVGEAVVLTIPVSMFAFFLNVFGAAAKQLLVGSVVLGILLAGGWLALLPRGLASGSRALRVWRALWLALAIWVPAAILAVIVATYGSAAPLTNQRVIALAGWLLVDVLIYTLVLQALAPLVDALSGSTQVDSDAPASDLGRRRLLAGVVTGAVALVGLATVGRFLRDVRGGAVASERDELSPAITPVGDFYVISKNFLDPDVDADDWELTISGLVDRSQVFSYADLLALPGQQQLTTLSCISNEVGGDLISNASWTGVPLASLLALAGIRPEATELALYAHDGYSESIPLAKALEPHALLAYQMNDAPLTRKHGHPARLVIPGRYGIKNVKWLREIELLPGDFRGYWQQRGWTDDGTTATLSRIDIPTNRAIVARGPLEIAGIAFAGDRGIARVELRIDDGPWQPVDEMLPIAPLAWLRWRSTWNPPGSGAYTLRVRAWDGNDEVQVEARRKPIPDGATGYHTIEIGVT